MPAPALALPVVTMPAWAPLAMTAVGLGGTYLTNKDKIDRQLERIATLGGMIPSFTGNRADTNIQWRDGTVTDGNGTVVTQPPATTTVPIDDTPVVATVPAVETDLGNIGITPPPRKPEDPLEKGKKAAAVDQVIQKGGGAVFNNDGEVAVDQPPTTTTVPIDDTPVVATVPSVETDLGNIGITPPPIKPDDPFEKGKRSAAVGEVIGKGIDAVVPDEETPVVVESDKPVVEKVDDFLAMKNAWLHKTRNSPAANAGFDPDDRWALHMNDQAWRKSKGRRYNEALDPYLQPHSSDRKWDVFGKEVIMKDKPSVTDKVDDFLETVPAPTNPIEVQFGGDNESSTEATNPIEIQLGGNTTTTEEPVKKTAQQIIEEEKKRRLEKIMSDDFLPNIK